MSRAARIGLLAALALATASALAWVPPIPQSAAYHDFADQRPLLGVPNALNVLSNLSFLFIGGAGLAFIIRQPLSPGGCHLRAATERWPWGIFFLGVAFTFVGSAWYHLAPDNARLVWDRLPMTLAFMSLFAAMICERIDIRAGLWLLAPLLLIGLASVLYWRWTELGGAGDLRAYAAVQFFPLVAIPLLILIFPPRDTRAGSIWVALAWYGLAKLFEELDGPIYDLSAHIVSGHTLKHLAAGTAAWIFLRMLRFRVPARARAER